MPTSTSTSTSGAGSASGASARARGGAPARALARASRRRAGFTLIESLVVLALLGVVLSVALPAYREQVARARRSELQADLLDDAAYMHRYYAANNAFGGEPPPVLPQPGSPRAGPPAYTIALAVPPDDPAGFLLTATRTGAMRTDRCGDFTYDHLGRRGLVPGTAAPGVSAEACWR